MEYSNIFFPEHSKFIGTHLSPEDNYNESHGFNIFYRHKFFKSKFEIVNMNGMTICIRDNLQLVMSDDPNAKEILLFEYTDHKYLETTIRGTDYMLIYENGRFILERHTRNGNHGHQMVEFIGRVDPVVRPSHLPEPQGLHLKNHMLIIKDESDPLVTNLVDGFLSSNPIVVKDHLLNNQLSYVDSRESIDLLSKRNNVRFDKIKFYFFFRIPYFTPNSNDLKVLLDKEESGFHFAIRRRDLNHPVMDVSMTSNYHTYQDDSVILNDHQVQKMFKYLNDYVVFHYPPTDHENKDLYHHSVHHMFSFGHKPDTAVVATRSDNHIYTIAGVNNDRDKHVIIEEPREHNHIYTIAGVNNNDRDHYEVVAPKQEHNHIYTIAGVNNDIIRVRSEYERIIEKLRYAVNLSEHLIEKYYENARRELKEFIEEHKGYRNNHIVSLPYTYENHKHDEIVDNISNL